MNPLPNLVTGVFTFASLVYWLRSGFPKLFDLMWCAVKTGFCRLMEQILGFFSDWFLGVLQDFVPQAPPNWDIGWLVNFIGAANYWFPVTEGLAALATYGGWKIAFLVVRTIKHMIPGLA